MTTVFIVLQKIPFRARSATIAQESFKMSRLRNRMVSDIRKVVLAAAALAALVTGGAIVAAQNAGAENSPAVTDQEKLREKKLAAGEADAKQMLLLMDRDQSGKVSRQEFMTFMQEEFDLLDKNKDGELDVNELLQSRFVPRGGVHR
jgi:hypothetical protein